MIVGTCWYLSGLLLLASLCASAITIAPGHETFGFAIVTGNVIGSLLFAGGAIFLHTRQWHWIRESRLAKNLFLGLAGLATFYLIIGVVLG